MSDRTRDAAREAAHAAGQNVGEWVDRVLAEAAQEARHPKPPPASREEVAALIDARLRPLEAALERIAERFTALEEKLERRTGPTSAGSGTRGQHPRGPRLRLPDT